LLTFVVYFSCCYCFQLKSQRLDVNVACKSKSAIDETFIGTSDLYLSLGLDFGTSGVRSCVIQYNKGNRNVAILDEQQLLWSEINLPSETPKSWQYALEELVNRIPLTNRRLINRICASGTSSTAIIYDSMGCKVQEDRGTRMYNFNIMDSDAQLGKKVMDIIKSRCPADSATASTSSTLAKLLLWHLQKPLESNDILIHQADFISNTLLIDGFGYLQSGAPIPIDKSKIVSDWHNALKLGYDVHELKYPTWLLNLLRDDLGMEFSPLPQVVLQPGVSAGKVCESVAAKLGLDPQCQVVAGTTDSIAAFVASGAQQLGQAVSSLGSTLAIKALSSRPVQDSSRGIYSHRLSRDDLWLVGGASNVGCAILRQEGFSNEELVQCSAKIDPSTDSGTQFYPLLRPGERFPVSDPFKQPVLTPRPEDRSQYLHCILEGIARVEAAGYAALEDLGATPITEVFTAGGGSKNDMWTAMRARILQRNTSRAANVDAAFGCARLGVWYL